MLSRGPGVIAGVLGPSAVAYREQLRRALDACAYSVPLDTALWSGSEIVVGCAHSTDMERRNGRLIEERPGGTVWLGTGEIDNDQLLQAGAAGQHSVPSGSFLTLMAGLYERHGTGFLGRVDGRFAIAAWDGQKKALILARDPLGAKQLFTASLAGHLLFASDTRVLRALLPASTPSAKAILEYLVFNYPLGRKTYYEGISSLAPGSVLVCEVGESPIVHSVGRLAPQEPALDYRRVLGEVVRNQIGSGEGVGFHLSGGIDSSLLCHLARQRLCKPIETFTAYYLPEQDDLHYGRLVAQEVQAQSHEVLIQPSDFRDQLPHLVRRLDSPITAIGVATWWFTARAAAERGVHAVMSGVGADHPFFGPKRVLTAGWLGKPAPGDLYDAVTNVDPETIRAYVNDERLSIAVDQLREDFVTSIDPGDEPAVTVEHFYRDHFLREHMRMAEETHADWSVDIRFPFLQPELLEIGMKLAERATPEELSTKGFLREMLRGFGSAAAERYAKEQMALPLEEIRTLLRQSMLMEFSRTEYQIPGLDYQKLCALVQSRQPGTKSELRFLWVMYNLHLWLSELGCSPPKPWSL